jgi:hypothetical protein
VPDYQQLVIGMVSEWLAPKLGTAFAYRGRKKIQKKLRFPFTGCQGSTTLKAQRRTMLTDLLLD